MRPSLSVLIVAFNSSSVLAQTIPALLAEVSAGDELIVVDNDSRDDSAAVATALAPDARILAMGRNVGFAAGVNAAAAAARGDLLVILNPDAKPLPGWGEAIRRPWLEGRGWSAWQALIAAGGAAEINSAGNPVHFTGIVWAGGHGDPITAAPSAGEVAALSGACLAIPRRTWRELGGFPERFYLYHEDVDLSLRLRLRGGTIGIEPSAVVEHDYEFSPANDKWRWLERNRLATLVRLYPAPLMVLLAPALVATELALVVASLSGGWARHKVRADIEVLRWLPRLLRERRAIARERTISAAAFAAPLTADLDSTFLPAAVRSAPVRLGLRAYWWLVRALLPRR